MNKKINRSSLAEEYFKKGYACSQATALAFKDLIKIDKQSLLKIALPFGGGFARLREVCGAFSGILLIYGYIKGNHDIDIKKKENLYKEVQKMADEFIKLNGCLRCKDLLKLHGKSNPKPSKRDAKYYHNRPCIKIVGNAAKILDKHLK